MRTREDYNAKQILGQITRKLRDHNGELLREDTFKNIVTYSATNLLAKAIAGDISVKISHIRAGGVLTTAYSTGNKFMDQVPAREDKVMYYSTGPNAGSDTVLSLPATFLRFDAVETVPQTPAQQVSNAVYYQATLDFSAGNGYTFDELGMYGDSNNTMFSHAKVDPIGKTSAFQIEYEWSLIFR